MYKNILVPIALEHGRDTRGALDITRRLLKKDGTITALHVLESLPGYVSQYMPEGHFESRLVETEAALRAELGGAGDIRIVVVTGHAGRAVLDYAEDHDIDLIVLASHRPGLQDYFLGSTAARVVRHASCAVHILR